MTSREFPNSYADYDGQSLVDSRNGIDGQFKERIKAAADQLLTTLYSRLTDEIDWGDYSVYTGTSGLALLHLLMHEVLGHGHGDEYLKKALTYVERPLHHLKRKRATFLCGDAGPLAVAAVLYHLLHRTDESNKCLKRLHSRAEEACDDTSLPDELLFGRVGVVYGLLYVQRRLGKEFVNSELLQKLHKLILGSGRRMAERTGTDSRLMYAWHDKVYLGAAHGLAGIFYTLMTAGIADRKQLDELVAPSIEYMMTLKFPPGNYQSSLGSSTGDKLVHWCHGAPGWLYMFAKAYQTFGQDKYLTAAVECGEVIWSRGILRKGYGICHGTAGNGLCFLALYNLTHDPKYLYRACKFAEWCFDYGKHGCQKPDRPLSLFEGLAGTIYFLVSLLDAEKAKFPAFEL